MNNTPTVTSTLWGSYKGTEVRLFRITNSNGSSVELTNFGATIVSISVPDKEGKFGDVVVGFPQLEGYLKDQCYIGSTIGRFANRIGGASFALDGKQYFLEPNDGDNSNHGGYHGFNAQAFTAEVHDNVLTFSLQSTDGDGGFPGNMELYVDYSWSDDNELTIRYRATTDKQTVANFTNHAYFNLSAGQSDIFDQRLCIGSNRILEANDSYIPTGKIIPAGRRSFDGHPLKERLKTEEGHVSGINSYYIFDGSQSDSSWVCLLEDDHSGRQMEVYTSYPGMMLYTGDFLQSKVAGHGGRLYEPFDGLCLECQHYPDSPNHKHFPSTVLDPGEQYDEFIRFKFNTKPV